MDIRTCATSLLEAGWCCDPSCLKKATHAVIASDGDALVEHAVCEHHTQGRWLAVKRIRAWAPEWKPEGV